MATGGEVHGQQLDSAGSEALQELKCQPCLEDGNLLDVVGMCADCQEYLCLKCYQAHTLPKPMRRHQLLDREQIMTSQVRLSPKDVCIEKCSVHDDEVIKYYCKSHGQLGCLVCVTLDHPTCKGVQYIPQEAKNLANSEEYKLVERQLRSALKTFQTVSEITERNSDEFAANCNEALKKIKEHRKKVEEAFDYIETNLVEKTQALKSANIQELKVIGDKYKIAHEELQASLRKIETFETTRQHCSSYTEIMRTKERFMPLDAQIKEADMHKSCSQRQVKFTPNQDILDTLNDLEAFGTVSLSSIGSMVSVKHVKDINVKSGTDVKTCCIRGSVVLTDGRLVLADKYNSKVKTVNVENGQILSQLMLSSLPFDITAISKNKVAVTLPYDKKVVTLTVGDNSLSIDRTLTVSGNCCGVDYRNDKLAVSFSYPHKVQVLNLHGTVLYDISADKQGKSLFNNPYFLTYGHDDKTLYVSNYFANNVVCVKLSETDGTVVATYTDRDLVRPRTLVVDSSGNVHVCAQDSHSVHQLSKDCRKLRVLLTKTDGLSEPLSICLSKEEDRLYVTTRACIKVYERVQ